MKKINKLLYILLCVFFVTNTGCDKGFEELNQNPNEPIVVPSGLLVADQVRVAANRLYSTFVGGDMGACWVQHWAKVQYNDEARYIPRQSVIEVTWKNFYEDVIGDATTMYDLAVEEENMAMQGVARTIQAYGYHTLTDLYGDIPFSEAIKGAEGNFTPKYDSQQEVYNGILAMLDEAHTLLDAGEGSINTSSDLLYGGDAAKWQKFANSLKFRCLMRISGKVDVAAQLADLTTRPMFESNSDEAKLMYLAANPNANPIYETIVFGTRNEWKANSVLVDKLTSLGDPRINNYVGLNDAGEQRGKPSGIFNVPNDDYNYANVSPLGEFYLNPELPGYFMSYSELRFLMAEAAEKGWISAGSAEEHYNAGITASFEANGIGGSAGAYLAQPNVAYNATNGLQQIAEQNWLALFGQGVEAWTEWRRTGYPVLLPALEANEDQIPSRYTYPPIEQSVNGANHDAAIANQGGVNSLTNKVWWMN